jgi:hypothetical protein
MPATWQNFWNYYAAKNSAGSRYLARLRAASDGSAFDAPPLADYDAAVRMCIEDESAFEAAAAAAEQQEA